VKALLIGVPLVLLGALVLLLVGTPGWVAGAGRSAAVSERVVVRCTCAVPLGRIAMVLGPGCSLGSNPVRVAFPVLGDDDRSQVRAVGLYDVETVRRCGIDRGDRARRV
jgi:hypothetical protein